MPCVHRRREQRHGAGPEGLVADDHPLILQGMRRTLEACDDIDVIGEARTGEEVAAAGRAPHTRPRAARHAHARARRRRLHQPSSSVAGRRSRPSSSPPATTAPRSTRRSAPGASAYVLKSVSALDIPRSLRQVAAGYTLFHSPKAEPTSAGDDGRARARADRARADDPRGGGRRPDDQGDQRSELWVSEHTVKFHLTNIYRKLGVSNRSGAVRYAFEHGLVPRRLTAAQRQRRAAPLRRAEARPAARGARRPRRAAGSGSQRGSAIATSSGRRGGSRSGSGRRAAARARASPARPMRPRRAAPQQRRLDIEARSRRRCTCALTPASSPTIEMLDGRWPPLCSRMLLSASPTTLSSAMRCDGEMPSSRPSSVDRGVDAGARRERRRRCPRTPRRTAGRSARRACTEVEIRRSPRSSATSRASRSSRRPPSSSLPRRPSSTPPAARGTARGPRRAAAAPAAAHRADRSPGA